MKEIFTSKTGDKLKVKKRVTTFIVYSIASFAFSIILAALMFINPAKNELVKAPFYLASIFIFIRSFKYLKPIFNNEIIVFDKLNGVVLSSGVTKRISDIEAIQLLNKHQLNNNLSVLKIKFSDNSEYVIITSDASLNKNLKRIGVEISYYTNKPFIEIGTPWLI